MTVARILLGRFALPASPVAEGAHGALFKATDLERDNETVAVKLFAPSKAMDERILQAAWTNELEGYQALGQRPNLVELHDWGRDEDGSPYLVFEWLPTDLHAGLRDITLEGWDDLWPVANGILAGLSVIHSAGYVHRDLKPENVLLTESGAPKVADFGTMRLIEKLTLGQTLAPLGTVPYAPPERSTSNPLPAYDIYSFAVLVIVCLSETFPEDHDGVIQCLEALDLHPDVGTLLRQSLDEDPEARPESAPVLQAQLATIQARREQGRKGHGHSLYLEIGRRVCKAVAQQLGLPEDEATAYVQDDLAAVAAFSFDQRPGFQSPALQIAGQVMVYRCQPHRSRPGLLYILGAARVPPHVSEEARATWWRPNVRFRYTAPADPREADRLSDFLQRVSEEDAARAVEKEAEREAEAFSHWRRVLQAKFDVEDKRGKPIRYKGFDVQGSRVRFVVSGPAEPEVGEGRLVRAGRRKVLFGDVEGIENDTLILYVTKGRAADLPRGGTLEFDAEASKSKLRREQSALERLIQARALRPGLRELLLDPSRAAEPNPVGVDAFEQENLDEVKRRAVEACLGARDFMVVQGPPGTGKTTFIAELVAQHLQRNPRARIVVTSQTHIALDNALVRIRELNPAAFLLRLGHADKITDEVGPLSVPEQMETWRRQALGIGREFLKRYAQHLGIDTDTVDIKALARDLKAKRAQLHDLRSRIAHRRVERRHVADQIEQLDSAAPQVLAAAEELDRLARQSAASQLVQAAERFVDLGLDLAQQLETAAPLTERLIAFESSLAEWQTDQKKQEEQEARLRGELARALDADEQTPVDSLIEAASARQDPDNEAMDHLRAIFAEWEERFGKSNDFNAALVLRADVVAATCVGLVGVPGVDTIPFDLCIVDEASKATATEVLVPLVNSRRWVLVGDDKQLPPFVEHALEDRDLLSRFELDPAQVHETLFAHLVECLPDTCSIRLTHQHRMHPTIGGLISECFYEGELTSQERMASPLVNLALGGPVVWVDTAACPDRRERKDGSSTKNGREAHAITRLIDRLQWVARQQDCPLSVAVLTGYDAQRREIVKVLTPGEADRTYLQVKVATVDAYQGQEADVAVFSVTRSNDRNDLGFLRSLERVNVALSRARDGLVIVGDADFIEQAGYERNPLQRVLRHIRAEVDCRIEAVADQ